MCHGAPSLPALSQAASLPRPGASLVRHPVSQASETQVLNPWSWSPAALGLFFDLFPLWLECPQAVTPGCPAGLAPSAVSQGLDPLWASAVGCLLVLGGLLPCGRASLQLETPPGQHVVWTALLTSTEVPNISGVCRLC